MKRTLLTAAFLAALAGAAYAEAGAKMNFVGPKSIYAAIGLRTGDVVVNVDGVAPKTAADVGQLILARKNDGKKHEVLVLRNGRHVTLPFGAQ